MVQNNFQLKTVDYFDFILLWPYRSDMKLFFGSVNMTHNRLHTYIDDTHFALFFHIKPAINRQHHMIFIIISDAETDRVDVIELIQLLELVFIKINFKKFH